MQSAKNTGARRCYLVRIPSFSSLAGNDKHKPKETRYQAAFPDPFAGSKAWPRRMWGLHSPDSIPRPFSSHFPTEVIFFCWLSGSGRSSISVAGTLVSLRMHDPEGLGVQICWDRLCYTHKAWSGFPELYRSSSELETPLGLTGLKSFKVPMTRPACSIFQKPSINNTLTLGRSQGALSRKDGNWAFWRPVMPLQAVSPGPAGMPWGSKSLSKSHEEMDLYTALYPENQFPRL